MLGKFLITIAIFINYTTLNKIEGRIYDENTNEPLTGVRIISDTDTVYTDFDGNFTINYKKDSSKLSFNLISYKPENEYITNLIKK